MSGLPKILAPQEFLGRGKADRKAIQIAKTFAILSHRDSFDEENRISEKQQAVFSLKSPYFTGLFEKHP